MRLVWGIAERLFSAYAEVIPFSNTITAAERALLRVCGGNSPEHEAVVHDSPSSPRMRR